MPETTNAFVDAVKATRTRTAETIADAECISVIGTVGQPPDRLAAACQSCGAGAGWPCKGGGRHAVRKRAVRRLMNEWRARCAEAWNAREVRP